MKTLVYRIPYISLILFFLLKISVYSEPTFIDRYNNSIKIIEKTDQKSKIKLQSDDNKLVYDIFPFKLVFLRNSQNTQIGFFDSTKVGSSTLGEKYRETVCEVYKDLSGLFDKTYLADPVIINFYSNYLETGSSGAISSPIIIIYDASTGTLCESSLQQTLVTGCNPYNVLPATPEYNGYIKFDFVKNELYEYDLNKSEIYPAIDMYSIVLHETLHLLGFFSEFDPEGYSQILDYSFYKNKYCLFDKMIYFKDTNNVMKPILNNYGNDYKNDNYLDKNIFTGSKGKGLYIYNGNKYLKLYSPSTWEQGSSISHFDFSIYKDSTHIMIPMYKRGSIRRIPHQDEYDLFKMLGYRLSGTYGSITNQNRYENYFDNKEYNLPIGRYDTLSYYWGDTIKFSVKELIKNDINTNGIIFPKAENDTTFLYRGSLSYNSSYDSLIFIPSLNLRDYAFFSYRPVNNMDTGNITYIVLKFKYKTPKISFEECNIIKNTGFENSLRPSGPLGALVHTPTAYKLDFSQYKINNTTSWDIDCAEILGRNIPLLFSTNRRYGIFLENFPKFPYFPTLSAYKTIIYAPDTWDSDYLSNNYYSDIPESGYMNVQPYTVYQELAQNLDIKKNYIVDFHIYITHWMYYNKKKKCSTFKIYLDYDNPEITKSNKESDPAIYLTNKQQLLSSKSMIVGEWLHIKTEAFKPMKDMKWLVLGDFMTKDSSDVYDFLLDDIRIREASTSINTFCTNYTPCLGDVVTFTFDVWKDIPDDKSDVVLEDILPKGFSYIGGDFFKENDKLSRIVKRDEMDADGRINLKINALVEELPTDTTEVIKNKIILNGGVCNDCIGKTEVILKPAIKSFEMKKEIIGPFCDSDTFDVKISIKNLSTKRMKFFRLTEKTFRGFSIPTEFVKINGKPAREQDLYCINERDTTIQNFSYGNHVNELISLNDFILPPNNGSGLPELVLEYKGIIDKGKDTIELSTIAGSEIEGCNLYKYDAFPVNKEISMPLPKSIGFCDTLYLDAQNPGCSYIWSTGETTQKIKVWGPSQIVWVNITNSFGCSKTDTLFSYNQNDPQDFYIEQDTIAGEPGDIINFNLKMKNAKFSSDSLYLRGELVTDNKVLKPFPKGDIDYYNVIETDNNYIIQIGFPVKSTDITENFDFYVHSYEKLNSKIKLQNFHWENCTASINQDDSLIFIMNNSLVGTQRIPDSTHSGILNLNYPNPFSETTHIVFTIERISTVELAIYDILGNKIETLLDGISKPGKYEIEFKPSVLLSAGVYDVVLLYNFQRYVLKIIYLK